MTALFAAIQAVKEGDPFALRKAVEAMGVALEVLSADDPGAMLVRAESARHRR